jgi:hypothetical protein
MIIGKYDHILGPKPLYCSREIADPSFLERVLRDGLHTKSKYIILDFDEAYAQGFKVDVDDPAARGKKQLYVIILLRDAALPQIPIIYLKRMEMLFLKTGRERILQDDEDDLERFSNEVNEIYYDKKEILPLESLNLQIRSGINTIQGFCELITEEAKNNPQMVVKDVIYYVLMMLDSCKEITKSLDEEFSTI